MTLIYLEWLDACQQEGPIREDEIQEGLILHSAGLLVKETKKSISLAIDYDSSKRKWRDVRTIPLKYVLKAKRVKV